MVRVVGVRFKPAGKIYYFECEELELEEYDLVIVETVRALNAVWWCAEKEVPKRTWFYP